MDKVYYCRYYRLKSGRRIIINEDEIVSGPISRLDGEGWEIKVASGCTFLVMSYVPELLEAESLRPTNDLKHHYHLRTFSVRELPRAE